MGSREVSIGERAAAVSIAASALDAMAAEWIEARASGSLERVTAAGPALDAAVQDYRRARGRLDLALRRLSERGPGDDREEVRA